MAEDPPRRVKVHKVTLLVVDHDNLGDEGVWEELENARFPNDCMGPTVMSIRTTEVDWTDKHPLNYASRRNEAFAKLFPEAE